MHRPGAGAVLGVSFAALAIGTLATAAPGTLAPELRSALGLTRTEIGLLASLVFVGAILSSRRAGWLTDSAGPALVLGVAMAGSAVAVALAASAPSGAFFMRRIPPSAASNSSARSLSGVGSVVRSKRASACVRPAVCRVGCVWST